MRGHVNLVAAGFALTALSYGLARFAYGLLLPDLRADLALSATAAGWIGAGAFAAYCLGIVFAFAFDTRLGPRAIAVLAGLTATGGMALVAAAQSAAALGVAIALAGLSTGLTSPPLAVAVARRVEDAARPRANGVINAGTAMGIVLSGLVVLAFPGRWRELYAAFAAIGAAVTVWLWFAIPKGAGPQAVDGLPIENPVRKEVGGLCASALLAGAASTAIWTFGANILRDDLGFTERPIALAWVVLGLAGTLGAGTGALVDRIGLRAAHRLSVGLMAVALVGLAAAGGFPPIAFAVMALFGTAYIVATGTFLIWGITLYEDRPAVGLGLPFLVLAIGQTAGAPLFGAVWDGAGSPAALLLFAVIMAAATIRFR